MAHMFKITSFTALLAFILIQGPASAAPILSVQPSSIDVGVGGTFLLNILIEDVTDLYAYQFDVGFDPGIVSANSISEGAFLLSGGDTFFIPGLIDNAAGTISFTANTLLTAVAGASGSGPLAMVSFTALSPGTSPVNVFGVTLLDSSLSGISATAQSADVKVVIPEPSMSFPLAVLTLVVIIPGVRKQLKRTEQKLRSSLP